MSGIQKINDMFNNFDKDKKIPFSGIESLYPLMKKYCDLGVEIPLIVYIKDNFILGYTSNWDGSESRASFDLSYVKNVAGDLSATEVILIHNHPNVESEEDALTPSEQDVNTFKLVKEELKKLNIEHKSYITDKTGRYIDVEETFLFIDKFDESEAILLYNQETEKEEDLILNKKNDEITLFSIIKNAYELKKEKILFYIGSILKLITVYIVAPILLIDLFKFITHVSGVETQEFYKLINGYINFIVIGIILFVLYKVWRSLRDMFFYTGKDYTTASVSVSSRCNIKEINDELKKEKYLSSLKLKQQLKHDAEIYKKFDE